MTALSPAKTDAWRPDEGAVTAIAEGRHGDPFAVLGMHAPAGAPLSVRVMWPGADSVTVIDAASGEALAELERIDERGFFAGPIEDRRALARQRLNASGIGVRRRRAVRSP